jgi:putative restriction endonuclease
VGVQGWIATTDAGWYRTLLAEQQGRRAARVAAGTGDADEDVNFWQPSGRRPMSLPEGAPFVFKLKAPHRKICGFGLFVRFLPLPDWLAWDTFGRRNGVADLAELRARIQQIRARNRIDAAADIGCNLVAQAVFFGPDAWVDPPADWADNIVTGKTYDLTVGEGRRVWRDCLAALGGEGVDSLRRTPAREVDAPLWAGPRFGADRVVTPRRGQAIFRAEVLHEYGRACALTGDHTLPVLDAAHVKPYEVGGEHALTNGLTLRTDVHRLFDRGYVTFDAEHKLVVSRRLAEEFANGRAYYALQGTRLAAPRSGEQGRPTAALAWHREHRFVG